MAMNLQRSFDPLQKQKLGKYIYALRDPRDRKIFYVGQGTNDRVFDHFNEAGNCADASVPFADMSSKVIRILDIWKNNENVEWIIIAHNLPLDNNNPDLIPDLVESALFDILSESQNGDTLNEYSPPKSSRLLPDDLEAMAADFVNPDSKIPNVFIFPVHNALNAGATPYNATRSAWNVSINHQSLEKSHAVGLKNSISVGSYEIARWVPVADSNRSEFIAPDHPAPSDFQPLLNKNWNNVLAVAKGFWQRGNFLIVEFNGIGQFRFIRGSQDTSTWHSCV